MFSAVVLALLTPADLPPPPPAPAPPPVVAEPPAVADAPASASAAIARSRQLVVVTTPAWDAKTGVLQRYARAAGGWQPVGTAVKIVVGASGLAWGLGLHGGSGGLDEPRKMEGDGRAPAGIYALTRVLGKLSAPTSGLPSTKVEQGAVCVDDVTHPEYNHLLPAGTPKSWKSAEQLVRKDWLYDLIVVVDQNHAEARAAEVTAGTDPLNPVAGRGSCVFLHVWRKEGSGTAGCTAMETSDLKDVVGWLDARFSPLLVQLPRQTYAKVKDTWGLP